MKGSPMIHAQIVLFDGFDPLDVITPYGVLGVGGIAAGGALTVELASAEGPREVEWIRRPRHARNSCPRPRQR